MLNSWHKTYIYIQKDEVQRTSDKINSYTVHKILIDYVYWQILIEIDISERT